MVALPGTDAHPHARAVLGAALGGRPSHAYLFQGPAGTGKRTAARAFAAELLAQGAPDPDSARARVASGAHPDLTWVTPSGAHEMLRRDVDEAVVMAATRTPFEARFRVFVLEHADTMNDEAANRLLKTLEEPAPHVVLLLLASRPAEVLPTIVSRCQSVRFDPLPPAAVAERLAQEGVPARTAEACARLALGDGERARRLALDDGPAMRAAAEALARAPLRGQAGAERPWTEVLAQARRAGDAVAAELESALAAELEVLPRKDRRRRETEWSERIRRGRRRAETATLDHALQLAGLWYRDLACLAAQAPELIHHADRAGELAADADGAVPGRLRAAVELVDATRARLQLNVSEELACETLSYELERLLARR